MNEIPMLHLKSDVFLFACKAADTARTLKDGKFNSHLRYDPLLFGTHCLPSKATVRQLIAELVAVAKHHAQVTPQFRRKESIDLETISFFSAAITTLFADFKDLLIAYTGITLPHIPSDSIEFSAKRPILTAVVDKQMAHLLEGDDVDFEMFPVADSDVNDDDQPNVFASEIWDLIADLVHENFPMHAEAILSYAFWHYQALPPPIEIDWRIRPPVGELFQKYFRSNHPRSGARADTSRPKAPMSNSGNSGSSNGNSARSGAASNSGAGPKAYAARGDKRSSEDDLKIALDEVRQACAELSAGTPDDEQILIPRNSYLRAQQHALAGELGFRTESRGEGKERTVVIRPS